MKAKLDENLPLRIATRLRELGHDVHTTQQENLSGCDDSKLWAHAQQEGRTLITQDMDFSDNRRFTPGTHHGIVLLRLHSPSRLRLVERIGRGISGRSRKRVGGMLCRRDRSKNPRAPNTNPTILKLSFHWNPGSGAV
jgi:predicted nuclease of predicted toxin-antitoxin system